jgi:hypothetical protein
LNLPKQLEMKKKSFFSIVILYSVLIFINTRNFSTSDDTGFLSAFDENQWYGFQLINGGRFFPLHGAELHLFRWIFPHDDYWFLTLVYGFSALTFVLCGVILFSFIKKKPISITLLVLFVLCLVVGSVFFLVGVLLGCCVVVGLVGVLLGGVVWVGWVLLWVLCLVVFILSSKVFL